MRIQAIFEIDEKTIKNISGEEDVNTAINLELGWIEESGISLVSFDYID